MKWINKPQSSTDIKLKLVIEKKKGKYEDIDSYSEIRSECSYQVVKILNNTNEDGIFLENWTKIQINTEMQNQICIFIQLQLKKKTNIPDIQCYDFCNLINNVDEFNEYTISQIDGKDIEPWESILICKTTGKKNNFQINDKLYVDKPWFHFAIYLWYGLYVSKFWKWNIYFTSLEEIQKIYNYPSIYKLKK